MSVVVVGSANVDLVYRVQRIPAAGETVLATGSTSAPGGKGNNQVTAAARAGADASFVAAIGADAAGDRLVDSLVESGVSLHLRRTDAPTGTAIIAVDELGENAIVVDSGANGTLIDLTSTECAVIADARVLLLQLETPLETVAEAAAVARRAGTLVVLNAAPIRLLPRELLADTDVLIVNEHEAAHLAADLRDAGRVDADERALAATLGELGLAVIITLGARGAFVSVPEQGDAHVAGLSVDAVDTTGSGDTFCGALVAELERAGASSTDLATLVRCAEFATAAAALSVQRPGAVPSIPTLDEIQAFRSTL
ncbi:ribokinase [Diaminobutyricibacter tongyongensis]|uniref:Ribokinase n=1 Tax=Leifsonia tongyongensis TaxID=1268043 RepID=A0A6L9XT69_9MICO|nr:ribokinase [Diaminobutyricibacter tongyongensis]NEN04573.1 ribokinase [Diaminobutyricibacter tongyongensis]